MTVVMRALLPALPLQRSQNPTLLSPMKSIPIRIACFLGLSLAVANNATIQTSLNNGVPVTLNTASAVAGNGDLLSTATISKTVGDTATSLTLNAVRDLTINGAINASVGSMPLALVSNPGGSVPDGEYFRFAFRRVANAAALNPGLEFSSSLAGAWTSATGAPGVVEVVTPNFHTIPTVADRVEIYIPRAIHAVTGKLFGRLRVTSP